METIAGIWGIIQTQGDATCVFLTEESTRIWGKQWVAEGETTAEDNESKMKNRHRKRQMEDWLFCYPSTCTLAWREAVAITHPMKNEVWWCRSRTQMSVSDGQPVILITVKGLLKTPTSWGRSAIKKQHSKENHVAMQHEKCPPSAVTQPVNPR